VATLQQALDTLREFRRNNRVSMEAAGIGHTAWKASPMGRKKFLGCREAVHVASNVDSLLYHAELQLSDALRAWQFRAGTDIR
jgi:hypothetical protein